VDTDAIALARHLVADRVHPGHATVRDQLRHNHEIDVDPRSDVEMGATAEPAAARVRGQPRSADGGHTGGASQSSGTVGPVVDGTRGLLS
jgi:hypothetical protein